MDFFYTSRLERLQQYINENKEIALFSAKGKDISLKSPISINDMISHMKQKNITFTDNEIQYAHYFFYKVNYYRFSIFPKLVLSHVEQPSFTQTTSLYEFDTYLREIIWSVTETLELFLKTSLVQVLVNTYPEENSVYQKAECYLDENLYTSTKVWKETLKIFRDAIDRKKKEIYIKHHVDKYHDSFPLWVLIESMTLGEFVRFANNLDAKYRKEWIKETFGSSRDKFIPSWIRLVQEMRNSAAHHSRIYGKKFTASAKLLKEDKNEYGLKREENNTFFVGMLTMKNLYHFLGERDYEHWNNIIKNLEQTMKEKQDVIELDKIGFPRGIWEHALYLSKNR